MKAVPGLGIAFLLFVSSGLTHAQTADELRLILTGKYDRPRQTVIRQDRVYVHCILQMKFQNRGNQPIVIINPTLSYGTGLKEARLSFAPWGEDKPAAHLVKTFELAGSNQSSFRAMAELFDDAKPPQNFTVILDPGETYPFVESFFFEMPNKKEYERGCAFFRDCGFQDLQLIYEFSFLPYIDVPDFLEGLNVRWRRYGQLPIGSSGTYTITSEKIIK